MNPANLGFLQQNEFGLQLADLPGEARYFQYGFGISNSRFGGIDLNISEIFRLFQAPELENDQVVFKQSCFSLSYGKHVSGVFSVGGRLNLRQQHLTNRTQNYKEGGEFIGMDFGLIMTPKMTNCWLKNSYVGFVMADLIQTKLHCNNLDFKKNFPCTAKICIVKSLAYRFGRLNLVNEFNWANGSEYSIRSGFDFYLQQKINFFLMGNHEMATGGIGYQTRQFSINFWQRQTIKSPDSITRGVTFNFGWENSEKLVTKQTEFNEVIEEEVKRLDRTERFNRHLKWGIQYFNEKKFNDAWFEFQLALKIYPDSRAAKEWAARSELEKRKLEFGGK